MKGRHPFELEVLKAIRGNDSGSSLISLTTLRGPHGRHLCLIQAAWVTSLSLILTLKKANPKDQCSQEDREKKRTPVSIELACIHPEAYVHEERETM